MVSHLDRLAPLAKGDPEIDEAVGALTKLVDIFESIARVWEEEATGTRDQQFQDLALIEERARVLISQINAQLTTDGQQPGRPAASSSGRTAKTLLSELFEEIEPGREFFGERLEAFCYFVLGLVELKQYALGATQDEALLTRAEQKLRKALDSKTLAWQAEFYLAMALELHAENHLRRDLDRYATDVAKARDIWERCFDTGTSVAMKSYALNNLADSFYNEAVLRAGLSKEQTTTTDAKSLELARKSLLQADRYVGRAAKLFVGFPEIHVTAAEVRSLTVKLHEQRWRAESLEKRSHEFTRILQHVRSAGEKGAYRRLTRDALRNNSPVYQWALHVLFYGATEDEKLKRQDDFYEAANVGE
jgi:hypothetical protein